MARLSLIQSARLAGESAPPTAPTVKRSAKRSPEVLTAPGKDPDRDGVARRSQQSAGERSASGRADHRGPAAAPTRPASRHRRHHMLVRLVGLRGRPWLELSPSSRNGPVRWLGHTWHVDEAGLQFAPPQQAENDAMQTPSNVEEPR